MRFQQKVFAPAICLISLMGLLSSPARAEIDLVISEVYANSPGSVSDSGKEWFELFNLSPETPIDLEGAVVRRLDGTAQNEAWSITLTNAPILQVGERLVLAASEDLGLNQCFTFTPYVLSSPFSLSNSGVQYLEITTLNNEGEKVKISNSNSFPDGQARERAANDETDDLDVAWSTATCEISGSAFGTPGKSLGDCLTEEDFLPESECGGEPPVVTTDGGVVLPGPTTSELDGGGVVDTTGNQSPSGSLTVISSTESQATLQISASDADHNYVSVDLYYAVSNQDMAGKEITTGLLVTADGTPENYEWNFGNTPEGSYFPFAAFTDSFGARTYTFGDRAVLVGSQAQNMAFELTEPDGINDVADATQKVSISWSIFPATDGVVSLYYDDDTQGFDGTPIVSGLSAASVGPRSYKWAPQNVASGNYAIYGILSWAGGQEKAYSPGFVEVVSPTEGCQCNGQQRSSPDFFSFGLLGLLLLRLRRKTL
jgi:hypothetical protein